MDPTEQPAIPVPSVVVYPDGAPGHEAGWDLAWQTVDWLVPGGALTYADQTPIQVIASIVASPGAVLQSHPSDDQLIVTPRYRVSPWEWDSATPDVLLDRTHWTQLGSRWAGQPAYNAVYVSGQVQGVLVRVYRSGSAGD